ncbi:MAG: hypothetical protein JWO84_323 [Parcubacteria group bacterium]|nr:hypothetical protein [Parcubacteria group bacterium]
MSWSRPIVSLLLISIFATSGVMIQPRAVYAQQIVHDPISHVTGLADLAKNTITSAKSIITGAASAKILTNPIFYRIAQAAIQSMVKSTVNWINSGFQGSPAYATNLSGTLQDAADVAAKQFVGQLATQSGIKSPFSDKVSQTILSTHYLSTSRDGFALLNPYTLNKVSSNDAAFLRGDISQGGFQAWFATVLNPQNNPIGASNLAQNELNKRVASAVGQVHEELGWGNGFFSFRTCDKPAPASSASCPAGTIDTGDGSGCQAGSGAPVSLSQNSSCLSSSIKTPGSVIAGSLNHTLGLGADSLVQAKDFDEIVNALMGQLLNNVLGSSGLGGLSKGSTATGGRAYFNQPTSSNTSASVSAVSTFTQLLDQQTTALQEYLTNWQSVGAAANAAKTALTASTCVPGAANIVTTQVQPVITQAATAVGTVPNALNAIDKIRSAALGAATADTSTQTTVLQQASADYADLLASSAFPSLNDFTNAAAQSTDTTGTGLSPSLLDQMNQLTAQAKCGH